MRLLRTGYCTAPHAGCEGGVKLKVEWSRLKQTSGARTKIVEINAHTTIRIYLIDISKVFDA